MVFIDQIVITQRFSAAEFPDGIKSVAGIRRLSFREPGDINKDGKAQIETEVVSESQSAAWLHGSHETKLQIKSDGRTLLLAGNPGRFGRPDNIWNLDLNQTIAKANRIVAAQGFPFNAFKPGELECIIDKGIGSDTTMHRADRATERHWSGSRIWSIHLTQNYITGSPENKKHVLNWLDSQTMRRVKKGRRGETTLEWGSISYCQTQVYDKAAEMLAHCKNKEERQKLMEESEAWRYAHDNGIIRVEVKCNKDYLVHKGLTYLGEWDMCKVIEIFKERTEILERLEVEVDDLDINRLPKSVRMDAAAWLAGVDLKQVLPQSTFYRKAKILEGYNLDVHQPRKTAVVRPIMRRIEIAPIAAPDWYQKQFAGAYS